MLNNLTLNSGSGSTSQLGSDLTIDGMLTLTSGTLGMNGHALTLASTGDIASSGTGTLTGSSTSDLIINSTTSPTGAIRFATGGNTLNNLTVNGGSTSVAQLGSDLNLNGMLTLSNGSLGLNGRTLTLGSGSNVAGTGTGTLTGSSTSNLVINATAGLTGTLRFATGGNMLNNLTLNSGSGSTSQLGSDLTIDGMLTLTSGTLGMNGHGLTLASTGDIASSGTGSLMGSSTSNLVINTTAGLSSPLRFATGGNMLNNLTLNTGTGSTTTMGGDMTVNGMLTLTAGTLNMNGHSLTLGSGSNIAGTGTGTLTGSSTSDLVINSTTSLTGTIRFATGGNTLNNLTVNGGSTSVAQLGSDLNLNGMLTLSNGSLGLNGRTLTLGSGSNVAGTGTGTLTGSSTSNLVINATAGLTGTLRFATGGNMLNNLTLNSGSGSTSQLGSDLTIDGMLTLTSGTLGMNGHGLTLASTGDIASTGSGSLMGSSTSDLVINTTAGLSSPLRFATGGNMLNNLTLNSGSGSTSQLGNDLTIDGMLTLTSGMLGMNGHSLTLASTGDIASTGTGSFMGSSTSDMIINSTTSPSGALRFGTGGNMLRNLTMNGGTGSMVSLGSDLNIDGNLNLTNGRIALGSNNLALATGAVLNGGNSGSYVITDGTGNLMMNLTAGAADTFEVGTMTDYAPMVMIGNTGSASGDVSINVINGVYSAGTTGTLRTATEKLVNATWHVTSSATTGINYSMIAMWSTSMELNGFNRGNAFITHYTGGVWDIQPAAAVTTTGSMHSMMRTGITSLSPFAVSDEDATGTLEVAQPCANSTIAIYPNPVTNVLHFSTSATIDNAVIYDISGQVISSGKVTNNTVSVQDLPAGQYVITLSGKDVTNTQKFIKQ